VRLVDGLIVIEAPRLSHLIVVDLDAEIERLRRPGQPSKA